jgi:hypothetical protein
MRKILSLLFLSMSMLVCLSGNAPALTLGTNITTWDRMGVPNEDGETEPNTVWGQQWDLEGFYLNGTTLTMVGGYNFAGGQGGFLPGHLFIDVNGDAKYGPDNTGSNNGNGYSTVTANFGYDYALVFNDGLTGGSVYGLTSASTLSVYYSQNDESNPYRYEDDGSNEGSFSSTYWTGQNDADVGNLFGGNHNAVQIDLNQFLSPSDIDNFIVHYTYGCGNDNLMGRVPEPATILLSGIGLLGIGLVMRRRFIK